VWQELADFVIDQVEFKTDAEERERSVSRGNWS
jgi:hypothetical protein